MNKELFVSSTPHETKVGLVEDDLLAEIYLERENEYTLAGSIYKGRVTRVLPGMQSAFVDIGLERDAFLYVSDFMELEEHDDDLTDVIPASRNVPDMRPQPARADAAPGTPDTSATADESETDQVSDSEQAFVEADGQSEAYPRCQQRPCPSKVAIPRIAIEEVFAGAGAVVEDVAMAVATVVIEVPIGTPIGVRTEARSEPPTAVPNRASLVLSSRRRLAPRIPPDISHPVRLLATSQFFFLANRFQSTSAWRSNRQPSIAGAAGGHG